jgi:hypothetical protein
MAYKPDPNEIGAGWKKVSQNGNKYISVSFDLDRYMEASGGLTSGKANFRFIPRRGEKTKDSQPDFTLFYNQPASASGMRREQQQRAAPDELHSELPELTDDDIPW